MGRERGAGGLFTAKWFPQPEQYSTEASGSQYSHHRVNGSYRPQAPFKQLIHQTLKQKSLPKADNI